MQRFMEKARLILWVLTIVVSLWKPTLQDEILCEETYELESTLETVIVTSPQYPSEYPPRTTCSFSFKAKSYHRLRIIFDVFELERANNYGSCSYDYIELHDGVSADAPSFGVWCGQIAPPIIISTRTRLFLSFLTDGSIQEVGFSATVTMVNSSYVENVATPDPGACYQLLDGQTGFFTSPGFPDNYENNIDCVYIITVDSDNNVQLRFLSFDLEPSVNCVYDFIEVKDGSSQGSLVLGRYCGGSGNHPPDIIESTTGSSLYVHFHSDYSQRYTGFKAEYIDASIGFPSVGSGTTELQNVVVCEGTIITTSKHGMFTSHDQELYDTYPPNKECTIIISGDRPDEQVYINFFQNDLSPPNEGCGNEGDFLEISTNPVTWLCERDRGHYTTSSNHVTVKFNSDENGNNNHQGFKFTYVLFYEDPYGCDEGYFMCSNERCIAEELVCDGLNHCDDNSDEEPHACGEGFSAVWVIVIVILVIFLGPCCFCICICINVTTQKPKRNQNSNGNTVVFANIDPPPYSARMPPPPTISASQNHAYPPVPSNLYNQPQSNLTINLPPPVVRTPDQTTISALGLGDRRQERNNILPPLKGAGKF
ncbi:putative dorsal-ventral patterning tolloid-like protein 1 [Apostichopus japonicus]|uniref:Putative dorsal-ventral patterning tolloid-like protein 1 n=1 Tax=Stichopus japonicus TaxID=307972 RepID=A0A2G8K575_STIJA|nr:putative dorsal-ventral patterning tolloid-like protein 1 [Apostichopus japonicus]